MLTHTVDLILNRKKEIEAFLLQREGWIEKGNETAFTYTCWDKSYSWYCDTTIIHNHGEWFVTNRGDNWSNSYSISFEDLKLMVFEDWIEIQYAMKNK